MELTAASGWGIKKVIINRDGHYLNDGCYSWSMLHI
jgi:hypothetical protein